MPEVRRAVLSDVAAVTDICHEVQNWPAQNYPQSFHAQIATEALSEHFETVIKAATAQLWVATTQDEVIAYLLTRIEDRPANLFRPANKRLFIENIATTETKRGRGAGRALMDAARIFAQQEECSQIALTTYDENAAARAFFSAMGLSTVVHTMTAPVN